MSNNKKLPLLCDCPLDNSGLSEGIKCAHDREKEPKNKGLCVCLSATPREKPKELDENN